MLNVQGWIGTLSAVIVALGVLYNTYQGRLVRIEAENASRDAKKAAASVGRMVADIKELAVNTNSIKDELVKVTGEKARAEGVLEGRAAEKKDNA